MLPQRTLTSRLKALRELRRINQKDFAARCEAFGLGSTEGPRVERGQVDFTGKHIAAFSLVLDVPEDWWSDPDLDRLLWAGAAGDPARRFADLVREAGQPPGELRESPPEEEDDEDVAGEAK